MSDTTVTLGILAGGGWLPTLIARQALARGDRVVLVTFTGMPQPEDMAELTTHCHHSQHPLGAVGQVLKHLKQQGVTDVVMAGHLSKPKLFDLKPDIKGLSVLARVVGRGDDALLRTICEMFAHEGFAVRAPQELCPDLLAPAGALGKVQPGRAHVQDIELGQQVLARLGDMDIGQAVLVKERTVLGVEAVEGTNALITRCAALRGEGSQGGVLVKCAKEMQTDKADLPTIGAETIQLLVAHGYAGVAVQAGKTLLVQKEELLRMADDAGVFVYGVISHD